ncbi:PEP-CTERM sorting domain-containing protein [Gemmatimonas sp.]|uniref:PEP-CTERM sorting domain-containing protein n=1 Tax=Gemmatimonas sp. TaxID=1962908 RepID=UPI00286DF886|nr:PEP-CTERM sorting domain-containing protein [Gemmatimonas sp.]
MLSCVGAAARRAFVLFPFIGTVAAAQATLGGVALRGTGVGFNIVDNASRSSSINISGFSDVIGPTVNNQSVVIRLNNLTHTWVGDLRMRVDFLSAALGTTTSFVMMNRPGLQTVAGGFSDNFVGNYSFGEYDDASGLFTTDLIDFMAFGPSANVPSGNYFAFDGQDYNSPGEKFNGLNPNGTWSLHIEDFVTADAGSVVSWDLAFNVNVPNTTVPEPSTVALMAVGLIALGGAAARRRRTV